MARCLAYAFQVKDSDCPIGVGRRGGGFLAMCNVVRGRWSLDAGGRWSLGAGGR
jgi:hypothetical protein